MAHPLTINLLCVPGLAMEQPRLLKAEHPLAAGTLTRPQLAQLSSIIDVFGRLSAKAQVPLLQPAAYTNLTTPCRLQLRL